VGDVEALERLGVLSPEEVGQVELLGVCRESPGTGGGKLAYLVGGWPRWLEAGVGRELQAAAEGGRERHSYPAWDDARHLVAHGLIA
jgi:hypothetical protein